MVSDLNSNQLEATKRNPYMALMGKLEELANYGHICLLQFPKIEKFLLCAEIRTTMATIIRGVVTSWKKYHKKTTLTETDIEVEMLRVLVRRALDLKYINIHRYEVWIKHIDVVGKMLGGWIKANATNVA